MGDVEDVEWKGSLLPTCLLMLRLKASVVIRVKVHKESVNKI